jgi:NAD(P)-dependent dehydrogenase (short-subunit alcohol dehydrogenase family)
MAGLDGQAALVTGGAVRIGAAIARALHAAGADIVVHHNRSGAAATALAKELSKGRRKAWTVRADLAKPKDRAGLLAAAAKAAGRPITLLVNNASDFPAARLATLGHDAFLAALEVNAWAPFELTRAFAAQLPTDGRGAVVNLVDARIADYDWAHVGYWLAKRMLADLTRLCAVEYAPRVTVNAVCPGAVLPPSTKAMGTKEGKAFLAQMAKHVPLRSTPTPDDIAAAAVHLLAAPHTTGTFVAVDGGRHLGRAVYG